MKRVLVVLASLIGLIAATAAAAAAESTWLLAQVNVGLHDVKQPNLGHFSLVPGLEYAITAACASAVAGLIAAAMMTSRLPRAVLIVLGLFSVAMLATSEYARHQSGIAPKLASNGDNGVLLPLWERILVPVPAFALLAVAMIWVGLTRRPVVTFAGFPAATVEPRRPVAASLIAVLLGALIWVALGLAVVSFMVADGYRTTDWLGIAVDPGTVRFGPLAVLYLVSAAALVVGGGLFAILLSRRLHPVGPIVVGVVYALAVVAWLVNASGDVRHGFTMSGSPLLAAVELGVQAMTGAPAALLAVPLIAASVWRIRAEQPEPTSASYEVSNDPTIPLY